MASVVAAADCRAHAASDLVLLRLDEVALVVLHALRRAGVEGLAQLDLGGLGETRDAAFVAGRSWLAQDHDVPTGAERLLGGRGRAGCRLGRAGRRSGGGGRSAGGESADGKYSKGAPSRTAPINGGQGVSWCEGRDVPLCRLGDAHVIQATEVLTQTTSRSTRRQGHDAANLSLVPLPREEDFALTPCGPPVTPRSPRARCHPGSVTRRSPRSPGSRHIATSSVTRSGAPHAEETTHAPEAGPARRHRPRRQVSTSPADRAARVGG